MRIFGVSSNFSYFIAYTRPTKNKDKKVKKVGRMKVNYVQHERFRLSNVSYLNWYPVYRLDR
jgi:hypothetical protein